MSIGVCAQFLAARWSGRMEMPGLTMNLPSLNTNVNADADGSAGEGASAHSGADARANEGAGARANAVSGAGVDARAGVVEELELMRAVALGTEGALDRLIAGHQADVHRMVGRLTAWGNDVDDLTQEVFLKAWRSANSFTARGSLRSWLLAIAVSQCRNHHRATTRFLNALTRLAQRKMAGPVIDATITPVGSDDADGSGEPSFNHTGDGDHEVDQRWLDVQKALNKLASRDRELLVLLVMEQQPADEVAAMLKITTNTLYVRLHRAKARLSKLIQNDSANI